MDNQSKVPASFYCKNPLLPLDEDGALILGKTAAPKIDAKLAKAVLDILDAGLSNGIGEPAEPGNMCVEAAVSAAMGMSTTDGPLCVNPDLRAFKISINDESIFNGKADRAMALRRIAIAQLGTQELKLVKVTSGRGKKRDVSFKSVPKTRQKFKWSRFIALLDKKIKVRIDELHAVQTAYKHLSDDKRKFYETTMKAVEKDQSYKADDFRDALRSYLSIDEDEDGKFSYDDPSSTYSDFIEKYSEAAKEAGLYKSEEAARDVLIEDAVQVLVAMKTPGSKFLYLTEGKAKKAAKAVRKRGVKA